MRKLWILISVVLVLGFAGCAEFGWLAGGAGSMIGLDHLLAQAEEDVQENIQVLQVKTTELEQQLAETQDEAQRARIQAEIDANKKMLDWFQRMLVGIQSARAAKKTDWKDPVSALSWLTGAAGLLIAYLKNRQKNKSDNEKNKSDNALKDVVRAVNIAKREVKGFSEKAAIALHNALNTESTETTERIKAIRAKIE